LAEELRALRELSSSTLVSVEEELRLCRSHVANMALRNDVRYVLRTDVDETRQVPPAVFHTLVENAMTHGSAGEMRLHDEIAGNRIRYVFEVEDRQSCLSGQAGLPVLHQPGGGTRYIEARLREAWGNAWSFRQGRFGATWRAEIEVPA
jgi:LytS/YehU family sensor histidine kinase